MIEQQRQANARPDFNGAALVDDQGREIPITEDMIQRALAALADSPLKASERQAG